MWNTGCVVPFTLDFSTEYIENSKKFSSNFELENSADKINYPISSPDINVRVSNISKKNNIAADLEKILKTMDE